MEQTPAPQQTPPLGRHPLDRHPQADTPTPQISYWNAYLLPPANKVRGKVIFSQASVILFTGGILGRGACMTAGMCVAGEHVWHGGVWQGKGIGDAWQRRVCGAGVHGGGGGMCGRRNGYCSGQYASYWNAFLLSLKIWYYMSFKEVADRYRT